MKLKLSVFFIFSLLTLSCHKSNVNEEKPDLQDVNSKLTSGVITLTTYNN